MSGDPLADGDDQLGRTIRAVGDLRQFHLSDFARERGPLPRDG